MVQLRATELSGFFALLRFLISIGLGEYSCLRELDDQGLVIFVECPH